MDLNFVLCLKLYDFISFYHPNVPIVLTKATIVLLVLDHILCRASGFVTNSVLTE